MGPMVWGNDFRLCGGGECRGRPQHNGLFRSPAEASFDEVAADELADATQTDATDWVFPIRDGVEVRSGDRQDAAVIETLGLYLMRVIPEIRRQTRAVGHQGAHAQWQSRFRGARLCAADQR